MKERTGVQRAVLLLEMTLALFVRLFVRSFVCFVFACLLVELIWVTLLLLGRFGGRKRSDESGETPPAGRRFGRAWGRIEPTASLGAPSRRLGEFWAFLNEMIFG